MPGVPAPDCSGAPVSQQWPVYPQCVPGAEGGHWTLVSALPASGAPLPGPQPPSYPRTRTRIDAVLGTEFYLDTVTSVVVCTSVSCRVGPPRMVGAAKY